MNSIMMSGTNVKRTIIPIKNTTISDLNNSTYVPEKEHKHCMSFLCVLTILISSLFCCITM